MTEPNNRGPKIATASLVSPLLELSTQRIWLLVMARQPHAVDYSSLKMSAGRLFELKFFISWYEMTILESLPASRAL